MESERYYLSKEVIEAALIGDTLITALGLASMGLKVLPLEPFSLGGKRPLGSLVRHGVNGASDDAETIVKWFSSRPDANLGLALGSVDGIVAVDIDSRTGGEDTWRELTQDWEDEWIHTLTVRTGDGWHLYYRVPGELEIRTRKLGEGLDLRGRGGYIVVPPSTHMNGKTYEFVNPERSIALVPEPLLVR